jgi:Beta-1,4-N-acetylgalactosaminyltransferase (CgtA)
MNTICGWLRIKNEMETLEKCLKSIENVFDYVVITYNSCTDGSDIFLKNYVKNKDNYYLYEYPYDVIPFADERYLTNNYSYENSSAALYNFALSKIEDENDYLFKIDGDTLYDTDKLKELVTFIKHRDSNNGDVFVWQGCDCMIKNGEITLHETHYIKGQYPDQFCCKKSFVEEFKQSEITQWIKYKSEPNFIRFSEDLIFMNIDNERPDTQRNASQPEGALKGLSKEYIIERLKRIQVQFNTL